ncbi:MAG: hypothetical protein JXQ75_05430 [Phycisphaerae bacterium]|nr:hypothetical protein [Phycisphaerae bacterium]
MSEAVKHDDRRDWVDEPSPVSPLGHKLFFVILTCLAFCLFAPSVLLPVLREYCDLLAEETRLTHCLDELESETRSRRDLAEAFAHDAVINERLAVLDLHYRKPNEIVLPVLRHGDARPTPQPAQEPMDEASLTLPAHWPTWAHGARRWADARGLIDLFLDSTLRPVFFLMSAGLIIAAFVLFAPRPRCQRAPGEIEATADPSVVS